MKTCKILVGLPATGKSTYSLYETLDFHYKILSTDSIVEEIGGRFGFTYNEIWKYAINLATKIYNTNMDNCIKNNVSCFIDRTNLTKASRKIIIDKFKSNGYRIEAIVFSKPSDEEWERRLASREGKHISKDVLEAMEARYEEPELSEGIDEIIRI